MGGVRGAERVKFEYVFGGVMPSPAGVNASLSKDLCNLQVMACPRDFHYHFCVAD